MEVMNITYRELIAEFRRRTNGFVVKPADFARTLGVEGRVRDLATVDVSAEEVENAMKELADEMNLALMDNPSPPPPSDGPPPDDTPEPRPATSSLAERRVCDGFRVKDGKITDDPCKQWQHLKPGADGGFYCVSHEEQGDLPSSSSDEPVGQDPAKTAATPPRKSVSPFEIGRATLRLSLADLPLERDQIRAMLEAVVSGDRVDDPMTVLRWLVEYDDRKSLDLPRGVDGFTQSLLKSRDDYDPSTCSSRYLRRTVKRLLSGRLQVDNIRLQRPEEGERGSEQNQPGDSQEHTPPPEEPASPPPVDEPASPPPPPAPESQEPLPEEPAPNPDQGGTGMPDPYARVARSRTNVATKTTNVQEDLASFALALVEPADAESIAADVYATSSKAGKAAIDEMFNRKKGKASDDSKTSKSDDSDLADAKKAAKKFKSKGHDKQKATIKMAELALKKGWSDKTVNKAVKETY